MVIEYIRYHIPRDQAEAFAAAYAHAATVLGADEHCLGYEVAQGVEEPENWTVRIIWDSVEGQNKDSGEPRTSASSSPPSVPTWTRSRR